MPRYYLNTNTDKNGNHEVHQKGCYWLTLVADPVNLGDHLNCHHALMAARLLGYANVDGCAHCSPDCHSS